MWARDEPNVAGENLNQYGSKKKIKIIFVTEKLIFSRDK